MTAVSERRSRAAGAAWFAAGYAGVAGFFALEASTRQRGAASSLRASPDDRGTTRMIVAAYAIAAMAAPLVRLRRPLLPRVAGPVGVGLEAAGLGLRAWSMRTLGSSYSRTLRVEQEQRVVERGPYRLVRHPGYAGSLLIWTGFALTSRSVPVLAVVSGLLGVAYHRRVAVEEALLRRDLPGYAAYGKRTKRLIPLVW